MAKQEKTVHQEVKKLGRNNKRHKIPSKKTINTEVTKYNQLFDDLTKEAELGLDIDIVEQDIKATDIIDKETGEIIQHYDKLEGRAYSDYIKTPISRTIEIDGKTVDYYRMAYSETEPDNIYALCKRQLPRNWFVCRNGEVLEYKDTDKKWYWRKDTETQNREKLVIINNKEIPKNRNNLKLYRKKYDIPKTKEALKAETIDKISLYSYTLTGIVYEARIFGEEAKEIIRTRGLNAFKQNDGGIQGHHVKGYRFDRDFKYTYEENMSYNNNPEGLLFLTTDMHETLKKLMIGLNNNPTKAEKEIFYTELYNLLSNENPDKIYFIDFYPKAKDKNEKDYHDIPIEELEDYHFFIDETKEKSGKRIQVSASKIPYIDIREYPKKPSIDKDIKCQIQAQKDKKRVLQALKNNDASGENEAIKIDVIFPNYIETFYVAYNSGSKDSFIDFIKRLTNNLKYRREVYEEALKEKDKFGNVFIMELKNSDFKMHVIMEG